MICEVIKTPHGNMIVCGRGAPRRTCRCGRRATLQCDWPSPKRKSGTCDKHLCAGCALEIGPDKHFCIDHDPAELEKPAAEAKPAPAQFDLFSKP